MVCNGLALIHIGQVGRHGLYLQCRVILLSTSLLLLHEQYTHTYIHIHTYIHTYIYTHIHTHTYLYTYIYTHTYIIYIHELLSLCQTWLHSFCSAVSSISYKNACTCMWMGCPHVYACMHVDEISVCVHACG